MRIERALRTRDLAKNAYYSAFHLAKISKMTSTQLNGQLIEIRKNFPKRTPAWVSHFLDGMQEVLREDLYRNHLEYCYVLNGTIYSTRKDSDRYYEKHGLTASDLGKGATSGGHYWIETDKVFFSVEIPTNQK